MTDPFELARFVNAQQTHYRAALRELQAASKTSHWMWFVFPQFAGLGTSDMSRRYAIRSRAEAVAYLAHPILGPRLRECAGVLLAHHDRTAHDIFGSPDDIKLQSCTTLFAAADGPGIFSTLIDRYFDGEPDRATIDLLRASDESVVAISPNPS